jgi:hypothetical protein
MDAIESGESFESLARLLTVNFPLGGPLQSRHIERLVTLGKTKIGSYEWLVFCFRDMPVQTAVGPSAKVA